MKLFLPLLLVVLARIATAQPAFNWSASGDTAYNNLSYTLTDAHGNVYLGGCGYYHTPFQLIKYSPLGNKLWQTGDTSTNTITAMCLDAEGNVYAAGADTGNAALISKYSPCGVGLWKRYYPGAAAEGILFFNGHLYVCGTKADTAQSKVYLQKYTPTGTLQWTLVDSLGNADRDYCQAMAHDGQHLLLTGFVFHNQLQESMFLLKADTSGNKIWHTLGTFGDSSPRGTRIITDSFDDIYVSIGSPFVMGHGVVKYSSSGILQWGYTSTLVNSYNGTRDMKIDAANNLYLAGTVSVPAYIDGTTGFSFTKLRPNGNIVFQYTSPDPGSANSLDFLSPNDIVVSGSLGKPFSWLDTSGTPPEMQVINFDSTGNVKWTITYTNHVPTSECPNVVVDSQKNILLGGFFDTPAPGSPDGLMVLKYGSNPFPPDTTNCPHLPVHIIVYDTITVTVFDTITIFDTTAFTIYDSVQVTDTLVIDVALGIASQATNRITVYPNPTMDHMYVDNGNYALMSDYSMQITNTAGLTVFQSAINQQQFYLDLRTFGGNGTYFVSIINPQSQVVETRKIVLQ